MALRYRELVLLDHPVQRRPGDLQDPRRPALVSARALQHASDVAPFNLRSDVQETRCRGARRLARLAALDLPAGFVISATFDDPEATWAFAKEKVKSQNDPVLAKLLMEQAIRKRDLESGHQVIYNLENHTAKGLLKRICVKKKTLISSLNGDYALKGDFLINTFSEAMLLLRVGRTKEAIETFVHIIDEKPVENEIIKSFLIF